MKKFTKLDIVAIAERVAGVGLAPDWSGCGAVFELLERMREDGAVVVIKLDGERVGAGALPYTVVASGGPLEDDFFRLDCRTLDEGLCQMIGFYADAVWSRSG